MPRPPENLTELRAEILRQLGKSEKVKIELTDSDATHELLAAIEDGINCIKIANKNSHYEHSKN